MGLSANTVGGAPSSATGQLNILHSTSGRYCLQMRGDHTGSNGIFLRAGSSTSEDIIRFTQSDENNPCHVINGKGQFTVTSYENNSTIGSFVNGQDTPYGVAVSFSNQSPDNNTNWFYNASDSTTTRFRVQSDGDVVNHDNSYGSLSDERIKQDIVDANSQWDDIKAIKVRNFKKKDDVEQYGDKAGSQIGVIAQELETVSPKLVKESLPTANDIKHSAEFGTLYTKDDSETQDAVLYTSDDEDVKSGDKNVGDIKTPSTKQIGDVKEIKANVKKGSYSILYMKAVKALQEAMTRIETLETSNTDLIKRVKALEDA